MKTFFSLIAVSLSLHAASLPGSITADEIVAQMMTRDAQRQASYSGMRRYTLDNKSRHAKMLVRVTGATDGTKQFSIVEESGSGAVRSRVFHKMLEEETAASTAQLRERARITPANYTFTLAGTETINGRLAYVLNLVPKKEAK